MSPEVYQAMALRSGLMLMAKGVVKPNRNWTWKAMLATASRLTGKGPYTRQGVERARRDLLDFMERSS